MWNFASNHPYLFTAIILVSPVTVGFGTVWVIQGLTAFRKAGSRNVFDSMREVLDRAKGDKK